MLLTFDKINEELYEWTSPTGSKIEIYYEDLQEEIPLKYRWRWNSELYLQEAAMNRIKRNKKVKVNEHNILVHDHVHVSESPAGAAQNICNILGQILKTKITYEILGE